MIRILENRFAVTLIALTILVSLAVTGLIDLHHAAGGLAFVGIGNTAAFPVNPTLSAVAIGYSNPDTVLISDQVMPRIPVGEKFTYTKYSVDQAYTVPSTAVGNKSNPTMVDFGGTAVTDEVRDWGLDCLVPIREIEAFDSMPKPSTGGPVDPMTRATMLLTKLIMLDREIRVAGLVFNASNYLGANQQTLSGTSQWSDYVNSNPLSALLAALDSTVVRPNTVVLGQAAWTALRQHPKIVNAVFKTPQNAGSVPREGLAELLEVNQVVVGAAYVNNARKGQTPNMQRTWGKHCALLNVSAEAAMLDQPSFGFTGQWGSRIAGNISDPQKGLRGGQVVRVGESVKEVISAQDCGYFFQNCVF